VRQTKVTIEPTGAGGWTWRVYEESFLPSGALNQTNWGSGTAATKREAMEQAAISVCNAEAIPISVEPPWVGSGIQLLNELTPVD